MTLPVKVALIQTPPRFLNLKGSVCLAQAIMDEQAARGAQLVVFPETWLPGYPVWLDLAPGSGLWDHAGARATFRHLMENAPTLDGPEIAELSKAAVDLDIYMVMGLHERLGNTLYNSMLYFSPDGSLGLHRKLIPTFGERLIWGRGDGSTLTTIDTDFGVLGGLICWEHWMPLARAAMHAKKEVIHVAQWPAVGEMHQVASRHYAFEGRCFVLASGCVLSKGDVLDSVADAPQGVRDMMALMPGDRDTLLRHGGSAIIGPDGAYLAGPEFGNTQPVCATIDITSLSESWMTLDTDGHYARPDVFRLNVNQQAQANVVFGDWTESSDS